MTPFDSWYSANIAPTIPTDAPAVIKKAARESMAACWNAALESAASEPWRYDFAVPRCPEKVLAIIVTEINRSARRAIRAQKVEFKNS